MQPKIQLQMEQAQKLVMTPELRQSLTILQLPALELAGYLEQELLANPILEMERPWEEPVGDMPDSEERMAEATELGDFDDTSTCSRGGTYYATCWERVMAEGHSAFDELVLQIETTEHQPLLRRLSVALLHHLDASGFLPASDDDLASELGVTGAQVKAARKVIQGLEPRGLGARGLADCLRIQLSAGNEHNPALQIVVDKYLEHLAAGRISYIAQSLSLSPHDVQRMADSIRELNPRPGRDLWSGRSNSYVLPDVVVERVERDYVVTVNEHALPRLSVSPSYQRLLRQGCEQTVQQYVQERLAAAQWLLKSLEQRQQTLKSVTEAVVDGQRQFLDGGLRFMLPMTLQQVADHLGVHESTVSRAINGKYAQTPRGLFPLKFFFASGVRDTAGLGLAKEGVQAAIARLVAQEADSAPLSDQAIAGLLKRSLGVVISRRTVTKYREDMGILSSRQRKRYSHI